MASVLTQAQYFGKTNTKEYMRGSITRWYYDAAYELGVIGRVLSCYFDEFDRLVVTWEENGRTYRMIDTFWGNYTPEQLFDRWLGSDGEDW